MTRHWLVLTTLLALAGPFTAISPWATPTRSPTWVSDLGSASQPAAVDTPLRADSTLWETGSYGCGDIAALFRILLVALMVSLHGCGDGPSIPFHP